MKKLIIPIAIVLAVALGVFAVSCTSDDLQNLLEVAQSTEGLESLVNVILAVEAAAADLELEDPGITDALADESATLTVFAPNNAAFVALFETIEELDENAYTVDENGNGIIEDADILNFIDSIIALGLAGDTAEVIDFLVDVISLHVIGEVLFAADVIAADGGSIGPTLLVIDETGVNLGVSVVDSTVTLTPDTATSTEADIAATDVEASNGVAHVLSGVLLPLSLAQ